MAISSSIRQEWRRRPADPAPREPGAQRADPAASKPGVGPGALRLGRRPALDGLRGVAVLLVILDHALMLPWGWAGVDLFFVLSGFLITNILCEERETRGRISFRGFYARRARRLLPALFLLLALVTVARVWFGQFPAGWLPGPQIVSTLFFANNWLMTAGVQYLGPLTPTWSLAQEEQFYLLWPTLLWLMLRRRARPVMMLALLALAVTVLVGVLPPYMQALNYAGNEYYNPLDRTAELLIGCAAAMVWRHRFVPRIVGWRPAGWLLAAALVYWAAGQTMPLRLRLVGIALFAALLLLNLLTAEGSLLARLLRLSPLRYCGRLSYGLYLYSEPVNQVVERYLPGQSWTVYVPIVLAVSLALAAASWQLIEIHFLRHSSRARDAAPLPAQDAATVGAARALPSDQSDLSDPSHPLAPHPSLSALPDRLSARRTVTRGQLVVLTLAAAALVLWPLLCIPFVGVREPLILWIQFVLLAASALSAISIGYTLLLALGALRAPVLRSGDAELRAVPDADLPRYTVLVPLYREHEVLAQLVEHLSRLDYPPDRLQILLLLEEDDELTRQAFAGLTPGPQFAALTVSTQPRTKPSACNIGLQHAVGVYCVIYDAEDRPEPDQLRKAVSAFRQVPDDVVCVQAELHCWNPRTNWLTRCFTAEYALRYSMVLHGLDRFGLPIPLGGTSNHFRADALRALGAWDPYNVAEDADLGIRIARHGLNVRMMSSVTWEEANSELGNWVRQRSRWAKGFLQTWLVHMRSPWTLWRELGTRGLVSFQLTCGLPILASLVNPMLWALLAVDAAVGSRYTDAFFPPFIRDAAAASLIAGNLLMIALLVAGCFVRRIHRIAPAMLSAPFYWVLQSAAAYRAVFQLLDPRRRHYWELTRHGLVHR